MMNPGCCARNSPVVWGLLFSQESNESAAVRAVWGYAGGFPGLHIPGLPACVLSLRNKMFQHLWSPVDALNHTMDVFSLLDEACEFLSFWKCDVCFMILLLYFY